MADDALTYTQRTRWIGWIPLVISVFVFSCSSGQRLKNLINYPVNVTELNVLDTFRVAPDVVAFQGRTQPEFYRFTENIVLQGRKDERPVWTATERGCFQIDADVRVYLTDFNFQGNSDTALIRLDAGTLILEHCDFSNSAFWSIDVGPAARLELRDVRFTSLRTGAVNSNGGQVKIVDCLFDMAGKTALQVHGGNLLELHHSTFRNSMGSAIQLDSLYEIWLDSLVVADAFQDGIQIDNSQYVLIEGVQCTGNGRNGLLVNNSLICGLLDYVATENLVNGAVFRNVDTLRVVTTDMVGNGSYGIQGSNNRYVRMAGLNVFQNALCGISLTGSDEIFLEKSAYQGNPMSLEIDSTTTVRLQENRFLNQQQGVQVSYFDSLLFRNNVVQTASVHAAGFSNGQHLTLTGNYFQKNQLGLLVSSIGFARLDSNHIRSNRNGSDLRRIAELHTGNNIWLENDAAGYFGDIELWNSFADTWQKNRKNSLEVLSGKDLVLERARFTENGGVALLNQVSLRLETCRFTANRGTALNLLHGKLQMRESTFKNNRIALELGEGTRATITQSIFTGNEMALDAKASTAVMLSYSQLESGRRGLRFGNYAEVSILSNRFSEIDGYCIELTGPHLQSLLLRQNLLQKTGGVLLSASRSGSLTLSNNSFIQCSGGVDALSAPLTHVDHNIFYRTPLAGADRFAEQGQVTDNCFDPQMLDDHPKSLQNGNLYADPGFSADYYLKPSSSCLQAPGDGLLIGARGTMPALKPVLSP